MSAEIWNAIAVVKDPRVQGRIDYPLGLILLVSLYATISGCDDWEQIEDYANIHSEDLRNLYTKLSGKELKVSRMPTHDTFNHVFQVIDPAGASLQLVPNSKFTILSPSYLSHNCPCGSHPIAPIIASVAHFVFLNLLFNPLNHHKYNTLILNLLLFLFQ